MSDTILDSGMMPSTHRDFSLYSVTCILIGAVIGGPLAVSYMMSKNFTALNQYNKRLLAWIWPILSFCVVAEILPAGLADFMILIIFAAVAALLVNFYHSGEIRNHTQDLGAIFSRRTAVLIGIISVFLTGVLLGIALYIFEPTLFDR